MAEPLVSSAKQNRILKALSSQEFDRLIDDLELVNLPQGTVLYEPGQDMAFAYFPTTCIVSLMFSTGTGASSELAMIGNDGLVGIPLVLGGETTTHRVLVQTYGQAYRLRSDVMSWELEQDGNLRRLCLCYAQALMTQMAQSAVCNRHHPVAQQLSCWLLLCLDRLRGNQLDITQEQISNILGVRRESITDAAGKLQTAGLINYHRGHITVTDRPGLELQVCECYRVIKAEYDRLFELNPGSLPLKRARPNPATLRRRAEVRLQQIQPTVPSTPMEAETLLYELQVHQIELEMHNEELRQAYDEADNLREKYADIYDFAPVSYFTLNDQGVILQLNLAGAILLGIKRSQNGHYRFAASVTQACLPAFNRFLAEVLTGKSKRNCEITLMATGQLRELFVRIEAVADEGGRECRMVVIDVHSARKVQRLPYVPDSVAAARA